MGRRNYDYVIIGAGSAGCTLAYRLSADRQVRVLILEAGGWDRNPWIHIPLGWPRLLLKRMNDWMYFSEPEPELNGRPIECARGKVVGGSSSINAMAYVRGNREDYNRWAGNGLPEWSYERVLPYFKRQESWEKGADAFRGADGPLTTRFSRFDDPLRDIFTEAGLAAGYCYTKDYNGAQQEGFGEWQATIRDGRRCSAAVAYLRPALQCENIDILVGALATRIVLNGNRAIGLEYLCNGQHEAVYAERELLLCGGVINSPQLLNLSGIGDPADLQPLGIQTKIPLQGVGQNLHDHLSAGIQYVRQDPGSIHRTMRLDRIGFALAGAYFRGKGIATDLPSGGMAFLKTDSDADLPDVQLLPTAAPMSAEPYLPPFKLPYEDGFAIRAAFLRPKSRGHVTLRSADPLVAPRIVQNFFQEPTDRILMRRAMRIAQEVGRQKPLQKYIAREVKSLASDQEMDDYIRETAITVHHPMGTCKMGPAGDALAVVDMDLRVHGIDGLRIVDASVIPGHIGGNINAPVIMIAEKAADMIAGIPAP